MANDSNNNTRTMGTRIPTTDSIREAFKADFSALERRVAANLLQPDQADQLKKLEDELRSEGLC